MKFIAFYDFDDIQVFRDTPSRTVGFSLSAGEHGYRKVVGELRFCVPENAVEQKRQMHAALMAAESLLRSANAHDNKSNLYDCVKEAMYAPLEQLPSFLSCNDFRAVIASIRLSEAQKEPEDLMRAEVSIESSKLRFLTRVKEIIDHDWNRHK